jgi:hypothetical protein
MVDGQISRVNYYAINILFDVLATAFVQIGGYTCIRRSSGFKIVSFEG